MSIRSRCVFLIFLFSAALLLSEGCGFRSVNPTNTAEFTESSAPSPTEAPTPVPEYTVRFFIDDMEVSSQTVSAGSVPDEAPTADDVRILGWTNQLGEPVDLSAVVITGDVSFYALTRPLLNENADFLFPDEHGFLLPQNRFTYGDAAAALDALLLDSSALKEMRDVFSSDPDTALSFDDLRKMLEALFAPSQVAEIMKDCFPTGQETVDRARAAACLVTLLGDSQSGEPYYPDVSPAHWAYYSLSAAAAPGPLDKQALIDRTLDGFLWFDGYLYRLDEDGYFIVSQTVDDLSYGSNGRYSSGSDELDNYVAETLKPLMEPEKTRLDLLRAVYLHVKNDFRYLPRNYYASGETGWNIPEALTMYQTGKGNCYNYTGVFWSLARGLGYNAVTYSGTMGTQNQPHSWTEILLDGQIYICDPEIELNYWLLEMYTDNFMMKKENSAGWNYQAVGRD